MRRLLLPLLCLLALIAGLSPRSALAQAQAQAQAQTQTQAQRPPTSAAVERREVLLLAVTLDGGTLSEAIQGYGDPDDPLLPVGELAQLLGLAIEVRPAEGRVTGSLGLSQRPLTIDLASGEARSGSTGVAISSESATASLTEVFIKASILSKLIPVSIKADGDSLSVALTATERLPLQDRGERLSRRQGLVGADGDLDPVLNVASPYRLISLPAFDLSAEVGVDKERGGAVTRFEGRLAGDLLRTAVNGFLTTDDHGKLASVRLAAERRSLGGKLLGPLGASYLGIGDVFSPSLVVGPRSSGGAGLSISNAKYDAANVFDRIDIRGELPIGYDVELYVNDVLRGGQDIAAQGRYEFHDVPLVRGINVIRLVTYGPRGERSEDTRVINVGGGQVAKGRTEYQLGAVLQDRPVIDLGGSDRAAALGRGKPRLIVNLAHGISDRLTVTASGAVFSDNAGVDHRMVAGGIRLPLAGLAAQADFVHDFRGGDAGSIGVAGRLLGVSMIGRHAEYAGQFADETLSAYDPGRPLRRHSDLSFDLTVPFLAAARLPISGQVQRTQFQDGGQTLSLRGRTAWTVANTLVAAGADYSRQTRSGFSDKRFSTNVSASRLVNYNWQLRASADIDVAPVSRLRSLTFAADRNFGDRYSLRLGAAKSFGETRDLSLQAGLTARMPFGDATLAGRYSTERKTWSVGLQFNMGLAHNPITSKYRATPFGPASGTSMAFNAFRDSNNNGRRDPGEDPVPGVRLRGSMGPVETDAQGLAFITGLGSGPSGQVRVDSSAVNQGIDRAPPEVVSFSPRAGNVVKVDYPFVPTAEVAIGMRTLRADGSTAPVAAVRLRLVAESGKIRRLSTEFDGMAIFNEIEPGSYRVELDPDQARQLRMSLNKPITLTVATDGKICRAFGELTFGKDGA